MKPTQHGKSVSTSHGTVAFNTFATAKRVCKVLSHLYGEGNLEEFLAATQQDASTFIHTTKTSYPNAYKITMTQKCDALIAVGLLDNVGFEDLGDIVKAAKQKTAAKKVQGSSPYGEMVNALDDPFDDEIEKPVKVDIASLFPGKGEKVETQPNFKKVQVECPINGRPCPAVEKDAGWNCPWSYWHEGSGSRKCRIIASIKSISWALRKIANEGLAAPQKKRGANPLKPLRKIKL